MEENIVLIDDLSIRDKIHIIRGVKVMLDFDLAEIYGYDTKNFNRQVKNNKEKFPEDMRFQLTREEVDYVSRCRNCTSIMQTAGMKGGRVYLPHAFTEQGMKTIDYYMSLPNRIEIKPDPSESGFTAWYPDLPGCVTTADTMEKVLQNAVDAKRSWLEAAIADGIEIKAI